MRVILLGPQRRPTVDAAVRLLATLREPADRPADGPVATVNAGWQEREADADRRCTAYTACIA